MNKRDSLRRSAVGLLLATALLWTGYAVVVGTCFVSDKRTVTSAYRLGGERWILSEPLYDGTGTGFIYLPQSAAFFSTWSQLPYQLGEHLWRWASLAVLFAGFVSLARIRSVTHGHWIAAWGSWCILPLIFDSVRNGQATIAFTGLVLVAVSSLSQMKFAWSSAFLWLALAVKPLALVPIAICTVTHRRMLVPIVLGGVLFVLAPFAIKSWDYALSQTWGGLENLRDVDRRGGEVQEWSQFFSMIETLVGVRLPAIAVKSIQVSMGLVTLAACLFVARRVPTQGQGLYLFALSTMYLALFSGRTESNTYGMIAPVLGILAGEALLARRILELAVVVSCTIAIAGNYEIGRLLSPDEPGTWLAPLATCIFAGVVAVKIRREALSIDKAEEKTVIQETMSKRAA